MPKGHTTSLCCVTLAFSAAALLAWPASARAQPPGTRGAQAIDLAPGPDSYSARVMTTNPMTHRLYVASDEFSHQPQVIKVIDTVTRQAIDGIDLGTHGTPPRRFLPLAMAADAGAGPTGNKLYVAGRAGVEPPVLRIVDGETNDKLTSDIVLPFGASGTPYPSDRVATIAVNPNNHKVYVATDNGRVVVVDGRTRQVMTILDTAGAGSFLVVDPIANKVFVLGNAGAVIDSLTDTFTKLSLFVSSVYHAEFNPSNSRIYIGGRKQEFGIFVVDAKTGALVADKSLPGGGAFTIVPAKNALFAGFRMASGEGYETREFHADTFEFRRSFPFVPAALSADPGSPDVLFFLRGSFQGGGPMNGVGVFDLATSRASRITTGYRPFLMVADSKRDRVYVTDNQAAELIALRASTGEVVDRIAIASGVGAEAAEGFTRITRHIAISERLDRIYLTRSLAQSPTGGPAVLDVLDGETKRIRKSIVVHPTAGWDYGTSPIAVDDKRRRIYIALVVPVRFGVGRLQLAIYDTDSEEHLQTIELRETQSAQAAAIGVNSVTGRIYVTDQHGLVIVDGNTNSAVTSHAIAKGAGRIAVNTRTGDAFITAAKERADAPKTFTTEIVVINGRTDAIERTLPLPPTAAEAGVYSLAVDELTNTLYAAHAGGQPQSITAYDVQTYEYLGEGAVEEPWGMTFDARTRKLFVSHEPRGTLTAFDLNPPPQPDRLGNIATRGLVTGGDGALIGGFIVTGPVGATKRVIVRALAPSLSAAGVPGALADTTLELHDSAGNVLFNDDWKVDAATNESQEAAVAGTGVAPADEREAAIVATVATGPCTAIVRGKDGAAGVALVEAYDLDQDARTRMANIATRGSVGTDDDLLIGGFIVLGSMPSEVLVRAIGPSLEAVLPEALRDPMLEVRDGNGGLIEVNDDWKSARGPEIAATTIPPTHDRESAVLATLYPGNYTAIVYGKRNTTGIALVEAYRLE